jgi:molybdenum cofactor cytidylyltransferase
MAVWTRETYAIVPVFKGQWGNPVLLGRTAIKDCAPLTGDVGAKKILLAKADRVTLFETSDSAVLIDFDTPDDWNGER